MYAVNSVVGWFVDSALYWFDRPWPALAAAAFGLTLVLLLIFRWLSQPAAIARARNRLTARVLELVLYRHDAFVSFTAGGRILAANLAYLRALAFPLVCSAIPAALVLTQLAAWFEWRPLKAGEAVLVEVRLREGFPVMDRPVLLGLPDNVRFDSPGVRIPVLAEVDWRVRAEGEGGDSISVRTCEVPPVVKQLVVNDALQKVSPLRTKSHWRDSWLYPVEPPIDATDGVNSVAVRYPAREWYVGDYEVDWLVALMVFSVVFGLILKRPLGVQI